MSYELELSTDVKKSLKKIKDKKFLDEIDKKFLKISENPRLGKPLSDVLSNYLSERIGSFRILYRIDNDKNSVFVVSIGHRKDIYKIIEFKKRVIKIV